MHILRIDQGDDKEGEDFRMNKTDREQVGEVRQMVQELWEATPPPAMFRTGNYSFRVRDKIEQIRDALDALVGGDEVVEVEADGEADGEG